MRRSEAFQRFEDLNAAGLVPNLTSGGHRALNGTRRRVLLHHVRHVLDFALHEIATSQGAVVATEADPDLVAILPVLADFAWRYALPKGKDHASKVTADVRLFVATIKGVQRARIPVAEAVLPAWQPMYDALVAYYVLREGEPRKFLKPLRELHRVLLKRGIVDPRQVPSWEQVKAYAEEDGFHDHRFQALVSAYRLARELLPKKVAQEYPELWLAARAHERGVRTIPNLVERLRQLRRRAGGTPAVLTEDEPSESVDASTELVGEPADAVDDENAPRHPGRMSTIRLLELLAPQIAKEVKAALREGRKLLRGPDWEAKVVGTASRWVAALYAITDEVEGIDPTRMSFLTLFSVMLPWEPDDDDEDEKEMLAGVFGAHTAGGQTEQAEPTEISLAARILDRTARASYLNSPLTLTAEDAEDDAVPYYTRSLRTELEVVWRLVERHLRKHAVKTHPAVWAKAQIEHERIVARIKEHNLQRYVAGQKAKGKLLEQITWPQAVFMGLPLLWREARAARVRYQEAVDRLEAGRTAAERSADTQSPKHLDLLATQGARVRRARSEYNEPLRLYLLFALMLDDGMRTQNYANAIVNVHLKPQLRRDGRGRPTGFLGASMVFNADDPYGARLKVRRRKPDEEAPSRPNVLTRSIVDMELLYDYVTDTRLDVLIDLGLLGSRDEYDVEHDRWGLFVSATSADATYGRYSRSMTSATFGRTLHRIATEVLGRESIPAWDDPALKREWRGLFAGHVSRLLLETYVGGVLGNFKRSCALTFHSEQVARKHYVAFTNLMEARMVLSGWDNPNYFDRLYHLVRGEAPGRDGRQLMIDWATFDYRDPEKAIRAALERERKANAGRADPVRRSTAA